MESGLWKGKGKVKHPFQEMEGIRKKKERDEILGKLGKWVSLEGIVFDDPKAQMSAFALEDRILIHYTPTC